MNSPFSTGRLGHASGLLLCAFVLFAAAIGSAGASPLGVPGTHGGVVATTERTAAQAGAEVLRNGGNAIDAAAAVAFALNVVEPQSSGIGGGGFTVIYLADQNRTVTVDSREAAPAAASPDMFVPFTRSNGGGFPVASTSGLAVGVPGMVRGVALMLDRWGTMSFQDVLQPAIRLAANGFRVSKRLEQSIRSPRLGNEIGNPAYDEARKVFRPDGKPLEAGDRLVQPALAGTLRLLAEQGPDAFYSGKLAKAIVATQKATRGDAPAGAGRMALDDLKGYEAHVRPPVTGKYRGVTLKGMGPPSSGGLTALEILKLMERFPLGDAEAGFGFGQPRTLNTMVEAMRLAFADRAVWMGDSDFVPVPAAGLLSEPYIERRSSLIDPDKRRQNVQADDPRPYDAALRDGDETLAAVRPHPRKGRNTTHFTVVDAQGNIVSYTNTVESAWGTGLMVPGYGFLLNNELTDFNFVPTADSDPEHYNPGANDVAPGKRPRSSICPVILFQGDTPVAAYGSPGGSTIINSVVNVTVNLIDHGMSIQHAVDAPRISQTSADGSISREIGFDRESVLRLEKLGHEVRFPREIGSVQAIVVDPRDGTRYGAADRRRTGSVINVEPK